MSFKVANIIDTFNSKSGGPPRTVSLIAEAGVGHWHADLFTTDYRESAADTLLFKDFPGHVNVLPSGSHTMLGGLCMLAGISRSYESQLLRGVAPDVIHLHGMWSPYLAAFALTAHRNRIPYVVAPHGMLEPWSLTVRSVRKSLALKSYQGRILANAAAIHATSNMEAEHLRALEIGNAPIFVIPNTVKEPPQANADDAITVGGKKVLLFLSRIHEKKGLDILLRAWNEIRPADWRLLVVGGGEAHYLARLKQYCSSNDVPDVEFIPHVEGKARELVFRSASTFVLPTYSENFGNVVAEALIRSVPVITTTGTPWSAIVEHKCGWYINPTIGELKRVIAEATATDVQTLKQMGVRGRDYAMANFITPVVSNALLKMYRSAMNTQ
jgi:glycosyltransferase involved in cell wall biosynthesis